MPGPTPRLNDRFAPDIPTPTFLSFRAYPKGNFIPISDNGAYTSEDITSRGLNQ